jgi:hypothetical protein
MKAVMVDYMGEVVKDVKLCGRAKLVPVLPHRVTELDVSKPHRADYVDRVFKLDGKTADGETYIYRETHWEFRQCTCKNGYFE